MTLLEIFFGSFLLLMILRVPLFLCLIGSSVLYFALHPYLNMMTAMARMVNAPNSFTLLAIPFFLFSAQVMNHAGVSARIFNFANVLVGHFPGGLAYVNVLASKLFAAGSGSALADVGSLGLIQVKAMREKKFEDDITIGVSAASATISPITPPSIPFVIYGAMANVSIGALFMAGIVPSFLIGIALCVKIFFIARKRNYQPSKRATAKEVWSSFLQAFWALMFPVIIIGGIWLGIFTPTEAAFVSAVYGIIVSIFIYREFHIKEAPRLILETIKLIGPAIAAVVGAALFSWIMTYEQVDRFLITAIFNITENRFLVLLIINICFLFIGMFLEVISAIMIMLPILIAISQTLGIDQVHLGVIVVLNLMIGLMTPPIGFSVFMLSSIAKVPYGQTLKYCLPWIVPLLVVLLLVTYFEPVTLFLPRLLGFM